MRSKKLLGLAVVALSVVVGACASTTAAKTTAATTPASSPATTPASLPGQTTATTVTGSAPATTASIKAGAATTVQAPEAVVAGDIPDNQAFVVYAPAGAGHTIKVPEGWARSADGTATVFSDKFNAIRVETMVMAAAPTVASVTSSELPTVAKTVAGYKVGKVSAVTRKTGSGILATYQMDAPPNAVTTKTVRLDVERYEFWKAGKVVVITLSSAAGSDNVDPWKTVTDGFGWAG